MSSKTAKTVQKQKDHLWKKGESGNPKGRPQGSRNKASLLAETLLENETEALVRKCIEMALAGESTAMRIVMERLLPVRKDRPIALELKKLEKVEDASKALGTITKAVAQGEITPLEGQSMANIIEAHRRAIETMDLERRLTELEEKAEKDQNKFNYRGRI
jgi:hypothetical protein